MTAATIDNERRKFLLRGTSSLAVGAAALTAMPFLASWQPSEATRLGGQPIRIDLTKLGEGEGLKLLWRGSPMWVVRRSAATLAKLQSQRDLLKDPDSRGSSQPAYANNTYRSARLSTLDSIVRATGRDSTSPGASSKDRLRPPICRYLPITWQMSAPWSSAANPMRPGKPSRRESVKRRR